MGPHTHKYPFTLFFWQLRGSQIELVKGKQQQKYLKCIMVGDYD